MIDALIGGKLHARAVQHTGPSGKPFTTAKVIASSSAGEVVFVNVITFGATAQAALLALDAGDSVALSGTLIPKAWIDREGVAKPALDLVAQNVTTAYHVTRKRREAIGEEQRS
jgi:single-stranded DNA-binding protein